ncbi:MAG TPA: hypothetical protein VI942_05150 [Thermoanaerobaculia bacterium]|nr:hypothetical protein [Thermoanaerobaculia bacterium]
MLAALAAAAAAPAGAQMFSRKAKFEPGETVRFAGTVSAPGGAPLADIDVAVEGWKRGVDVRELSFVRANRTRVTARSDERGEFTIDWTWSDEHSKFAVVAFVPYRGVDGDTEYELASVEVTKRLRDGSPVTVTLAVPAAGIAFMQRLRDFEASLVTEDEKTVYAQLGLPERVDRTQVGDAIETAWWYFAHGRVCRFRDGVRREIQSFPPIAAESKP